MKQLIIYTKHRRKYPSPGAYGGKLIGLVKKNNNNNKKTSITCGLCVLFSLCSNIVYFCNDVIMSCFGDCANTREDVLFPLTLGRQR